jgi:glyoxylase-like metal-dependent hydrolase (beta-lactamase superfamily II)
MRRVPVLALLALLLLVGACSRKAAPIAADYPLTKITDRVYVVYGPAELPNKNNQGFMNNPGFVLIHKGVVVVDPGSSVQVGEMLLKKIASVTSDPVVAVFDTHIHGDHWLGNDAIKRAYPKAVIYAHPKMIEKTAVEGPNWIASMNRLTDGAVKGTKAVAPDLGIENDETLAIGGMHFHAYHTGTAHTDGDLMIEVVEERVLFLGDNVMNQQVRRMDDGDFLGNVAACDAALKTKAIYFIPGHGKAGGPEVVIVFRDFLKTLYGSVRKYSAQGLSDFEMKDKVAADLKPYQNWAMFDSAIGKMISIAYLQNEQASF